MITIINTGVANIRSLQASFDRLGAAWQLTCDPDQIAEAEHVVLPGVGAFAAAMQSLHQLQLCEPIKHRIAADRPMLCICLGLQLLAESSEESPGVPGLGIIPQSIQRFPDDVPVPQLGWNEVRPIRAANSNGTGQPIAAADVEQRGQQQKKENSNGTGQPIAAAEPENLSRPVHNVESDFPISAGEAYFANSFRLLEVPDDWGYAATDYSGPFVSSCWRGRLLACQFHPELSGDWGEQLIRSWLSRG